jgi:eukaryotic-like serine/threonine-protein kinase
VLNIGAKLGPYEITGAIGAGGMGEVYRARDTKLQRDVALKILPEAMARDAQRMARFEREAQVLASLNHPNIAAIYGLEESNGIRALVMELVEGETLAERISVAAVSPPPGSFPKRKAAGEDTGATTGDRRSGVGEGSALPRERGALPCQDALPIAKQIAEALEYAHERGVIHRDLKPANVKITPEGAVKVLDFGLAKVLEAQDSTATMDKANSPTLSGMATQAGMILGTAAYMSPEQAKGQRVDRRADIWAFGCVLYEMLTGRKPFEGETISDVLASVIKSEPAWEAIPGNTPPAIQKLIRRCLQKDQRQRLRDIGDARIAIEETVSGTGVSPVVEHGQDAHATTGDRSSPLRRALPWGVAALFAILLGAALWAPWRKEAPAPAIVSEIPPPAKTSFMFDALNGATPELSPDGSRLAFVAGGPDSRPLVWVRSLDSTEALPLEGTDSAMTPFWSPDGRYLGFFADGKLKKVEISGGAPVDLCDAPWGRGGTWAEDGTILFASNINSPIYRVSAGGGTPVPVTTLDPSRHDTSHRWPEFLPDGQHFIFYASSASGNNDGTYVASLEGGKSELVLKGSSNAIYALGYLLFLQGENLMAQRFDSSRFRVVGDPRAIADKVGDLQVARRTLVSASSNGTLGYWTTVVSTGSFELMWFDRNGKQMGSTGSPGALLTSSTTSSLLPPGPALRAAAGSAGGLLTSPRLSPGGKRLAVQVARVGAFDIWTYDVARGIPTRLTFTQATNALPVWSPDGNIIAFTSNRSGLKQIYEKAANGTGAATLLLKDNADDSPGSWSADGRYLAYDRQDPQPKSVSDIWVLPLFGEKKPFPFLISQFNKLDPTFSPDGRWLAYTSDESGRGEVYITPFPKGNGKFEVSTNGGGVPRWGRDGKELFYLAADLKIMAVDILEKGDSIVIGSPQVLFQTNPPPLAFRPYDVTADGKKFVVTTEMTQASTVPITLVSNWPALLKKQ